MVHPIVEPVAPRPTQTALIAPVPAAEPVVAQHRQRMDASAAWGVPAHVTVLFPFVAPSRVDDQLVAAVADAVAAVPAFGCSFTRTGWFAQDVLWLDPEPAEPFRRLTVAMWAAFPGHPPYGGAHQDDVLLVAGTEATGTWRTLHRFPLRPTPRDAGVDSRTGLG